MTPVSAVPIPAVTPAVPFPLARAARLRYDLSEPRFTDILIAREVAAKINATRDLEAEPARAVQAGVLASASLLDEIYAHLIAQYVAEVEPQALIKAPPFVEERLGTRATQQLFDALHTTFEAPLTRPEAVEYALRLRLVNTNPALGLIRELFDDGTLPEPTYTEAHTALYDYFDALPLAGPEGKSLLTLLFESFREHPGSVEAQLRFLLAEGGEFVAPFVSRLLLQVDVLSEENKPIFYGPGPALIPEYSRAVGAEEYEAFSFDKAWMPEVVLLAKNSYVWLDQLSKKFGRHIYRLDQVPDEELDEMAARGFSGLWLIGLWQRSKASQTIKQLCGNPDAVASAYSLHSYDIAWELGGLEALDDLRVRAAKRGVRLASDMVPNHMAIDSQWVMEHPDWFLSLPQSPYPQYRFEGPDVSNDPRTGIYLENHYYSKTDAAVVFQRVDRESGDVRYVYHGNDGTTMPWNDTAQLNYLLPEVREALIQTILHVARHFPIIRFDAAMTLAKRHYHRLWFPAPGEGGAIPTRAGQGLTPDEFDQVFPQEFWREVVDRVAQEVPDTLLLAEAFWLMEGYFVRTLGMHRVYNSAFMNMMRDEKNAEYRQVMKNTLEFDPDIIGRYVNFMNNPDEKTSVEQFGKSDKYFGVCTLLATLPGLPMFGHGQIEGYEEKYGMEYPRAYWAEQPDAGLIGHHEQVIFPLLHRRALFAGSEHFTLYDFWTSDGEVNEDVFAYSNRHGEDRALVVYHNRYAPTSGWINKSVSYAEKAADGSRDLVQRPLGEALGLIGGEKAWTVFRDNTTGLEYLRRSREVVADGFFLELSAYGYHVFLDWREVQDAAGLYERLANRLKGQGVPSVELALREMVLEPLRGSFMPLVEDSMWRELLTPVPMPMPEVEAVAPLTAEASPPGTVAGDTMPNGAQLPSLSETITPSTSVNQVSEVSEDAPKIAAEITPALLDAFEIKLRAFGSETREFFDLHGDENAFAQQTRARLEKVLPVLQSTPSATNASDDDSALDSDTPDDIATDPALPGALWGWALLSQVGLLGLPAEGENVGGKSVETRSRAWIDEWLLAPLLQEALIGFGVSTEVAERAVMLAKLLTAHVCHMEQTPFDLLRSLNADDDAREALRINRFEGVIWFNKEGFETTLDWLQFAAALEGKMLPVAELKAMAAESGYRVVKLLELARPAMVIPADTPKPPPANGKATVVEAGFKS